MPIVEEKICCSRCGENKPLVAYAQSRVVRGCGECRLCNNAAQKSKRDKNIEAARASARRHYRKNREVYRGYNLGRYGITPNEYDLTLASQGGGCACCGATENASGKRLFVDHDHETDAVRGILCHKCNIGIGALGDDIAGIRRALAYLERAPARVTVPSIRINLLKGEHHVAA